MVKLASGALGLPCSELSAALAYIGPPYRSAPPRHFSPTSGPPGKTSPHGKKRGPKRNFQDLPEPPSISQKFPRISGRRGPCGGPCCGRDLAQAGKENPGALLNRFKSDSGFLKHFKLSQALHIFLRASGFQVLQVCLGASDFIKRSKFYRAFQILLNVSGFIKRARLSSASKIQKIA